MATKYTAVTTQNKDVVLMKNDIESFCPYVPPMRYQSPQAVSGMAAPIGIMRMPCSNLCPHADFNEETMEWHITCSGCKVSHNIEQFFKPDEQKATGGLVIAP